MGQSTGPFRFLEINGRNGPVIVIRDGSMVPNLRLRDLLIDTAERLKIPFQFDLLERGGTDSGAIHLHRRGVPNLVIAVPTRHIQSHAGILHREDYDHTMQLVTEAIKKLDARAVTSLTKQRLNIRERIEETVVWEFLPSTRQSANLYVAISPYL